MSKAPSVETQLRNLKREFLRVTKQLHDADRLASVYRARATQAEQQAAEWRERFDVVLRQREAKP